MTRCFLAACGKTRVGGRRGKRRAGKRNGATPLLHPFCRSSMSCIHRGCCQLWPKGASSHGSPLCATSPNNNRSVLPGRGRGITEESTTETEKSPRAPSCVSQCGISDGYMPDTHYLDHGGHKRGGKQRFGTESAEALAGFQRDANCRARQSDQR
jgi:hypothetical protein